MLTECVVPTLYGRRGTSNLLLHLSSKTVMVTSTNTTSKLLINSTLEYIWIK